MYNPYRTHIQPLYSVYIYNINIAGLDYGYWTNTWDAPLIAAEQRCKSFCCTSNLAWRLAVADGLFVDGFAKRGPAGFLPTENAEKMSLKYGKAPKICWSSIIFLWSGQWGRGRTHFQIFRHIYCKWRFVILIQPDTMGMHRFLQNGYTSNVPFKVSIKIMIICWNCR